MGADKGATPGSGTSGAGREVPRGTEGGPTGVVGGPSDGGTANQIYLIGPNIYVVYI